MVTNSNARLFVDFLAEASRNPGLQKVLSENIDKFTKVLEEFLEERNPKMSPQEIKKAHIVAVRLGLIFNGVYCWLAAGVSEKEVQEIWGGVVETLLGPFDEKIAIESDNQPRSKTKP